MYTIALCASVLRCSFYVFFKNRYNTIIFNNRIIVYTIKNTFLILSLLVTAAIFGMDAHDDINRPSQKPIEIINIGCETVAIVGANGKKIKIFLPENGKSGLALKKECQNVLETKNSVEIIDQGRTLANNLTYTKDDFENRKLIFVIKQHEERRADSTCCCLNNCFIL